MCTIPAREPEWRCSRVDFRSMSRQHSRIQKIQVRVRRTGGWTPDSLFIPQECPQMRVSLSHLPFYYRNATQSNGFGRTFETSFKSVCHALRRKMGCGTLPSFFFWDKLLLFLGGFLPPFFHSFCRKRRGWQHRNIHQRAEDTIRLSTTLSTRYGILPKAISLHSIDIVSRFPWTLSIL